MAEGADTVPVLSGSAVALGSSTVGCPRGTAVTAASAAERPSPAPTLRAAVAAWAEAGGTTDVRWCRTFQNFLNMSFPTELEQISIYTLIQVDSFIIRFW